MRQGLPSRCVGGLSIPHDLGGDLSGDLSGETVSPGGVRDRSGQNGNLTPGQTRCPSGDAISGLNLFNLCGFL